MQKLLESLEKSGENNEAHNNSSTHRTIVKVIMWISWSFLIFGVSIILRFAYNPDPLSNKWKLTFEWIIALFLLGLISLAVRFLIIPKIKNSWFKLAVFLIGLFLSETIAVTGMFALLQGQQTYILIGITLMTLYCPHWIMTNKQRG